MSNIPLFPNLKPRLFESSWFQVDQPRDCEDELSQLEREHQNWLQSIKQFNADLTPIGKTTSEPVEEEEDEDDEDDNEDDDESETHDEEEEDEIEMDVSAEGVPGELRSPEELGRRMIQGIGQGHGVR
ncbi:unnamed protein product [Phyllotreta striolata]|uniref:Anaphase-promoting complex subunit 15 n=1 Tax=Phyllotreta striolata TaxID=444603 RepID=A0A9N9TLL4_PHYSR|nr:unnamed protein product [Phyllotreta striolata]